jgi:hypothetical protein
VKEVQGFRDLKVKKQKEKSVFFLSFFVEKKSVFLFFETKKKRKKTLFFLSFLFYFIGFFGTKREEHQNGRERRTEEAQGRSLDVRCRHRDAHNEERRRSPYDLMLAPTEERGHAS